MIYYIYEFYPNPGDYTYLREIWARKFRFGRFSCTLRSTAPLDRYRYIPILYRYLYNVVILDPGVRECRTAAAATVCCIAANLENNYVVVRHYVCSIYTVFIFSLLRGAGQTVARRRCHMRARDDKCDISDEAIVVPCSCWTAFEN